MASPAIVTPLIATDPGFLYWAPLGTAEPVHAVTASVFSDNWTAATSWVPLGATEEGHNFSWQTSTEQINVAELLDPIRYVSTGRTGSIGFALATITANNLKKSLNGGTITTTGTGATTMSSYVPAGLGAEVRCMIGWESQDATERLIAYQCFNTGSVEIARRKGAAKATLPIEYGLEVPAAGQPFKYLVAGVARLGT